MNTFSDFMSHDHGHCDALFARAEEVVESGDWGDAAAVHGEFLLAMNHHFAMEEELLFPAFEEASGNASGPTAVMRHEHSQMRSLFEEMSEALAQQDVDAYLGVAETLLILMQQHNAKEEQILYPMSDRLLAPQRDALMNKMRSLGKK